MMMRILSLIVLLFALVVTGLAQHGGVKGKIRSQRNEKGLPGVEIVAEREGEAVKSVTSNSKGDFEILGLADGNYQLRFTKEGFSSASYNLIIKDGSFRDLSTKTFLLYVDRGTLVVIQGGVFDQEGFSLPGAKVEIARKTSGNVWEKLKAIYTDENGEFLFRFPGEQTGDYKVTVSIKDVEPQVKEKTVDSSGIFRLAFKLPTKRQR